MVVGHKRRRTIAIVGMIAATGNGDGIQLEYPPSCVSSGYFASACGLCVIRCASSDGASVLTFIFLHMVMKTPVWHLISRIDIAGGSSSYHRYELVDQCIRHFSDGGPWGSNTTPSGDSDVGYGKSICCTRPEFGPFPLCPVHHDYCVRFPIPGESKAGPDEQPQASTPVMGDRRCLICPR